MSNEDKMTQWLNELSAKLGISEVGDPKGLLNITREVAHNVSRPAAPLTLYLLGLAVGQGQDASEIKSKVDELVKQYKTD